MKIAAATFGCKINQYETSCIIDDFISNGWQKVPFSQPADVYVINSCTVTNRTDYKSRNAIRKALKHKQENPEVKIVVTGCYSQLNHDEIKSLGDIDHIIDNNHKDGIFRAITEQAIPEFSDIQKELGYCEQTTQQMLDRHRAFLKVQDGCGFFCAYCAVAWARGPSRSRDKNAIFDQINKLTEEGFREFVLGGINLGLFGHDKDDGYYLENLILDMSLLDKVKRIRLSSVEPQLFTDKLIAEIKDNQKVCSHFHIPLQSGSDKILKSMGRHYTQEEFQELIEKILSIRPDSAIGLDVITGLPGETEEEFEITRSFIEKLPIAYLHVFPYSRRPGTRAWDMPGQVHGNDIKKRSEMLLKLSEKKKAEYINKLVKEKTVISGIVEEKQGRSSILSDHYIRAYIHEKPEAGKYVIAKTIGIEDDGICAIVNK